MVCTNPAVVQSPNSPFFPPLIGTEPGRAKRDSLFARTGSALIGVGKKGEFRDWTNLAVAKYHLYI